MQLLAVALLLAHAVNRCQPQLFSLADRQQWIAFGDASLDGEDGHVDLVSLKPLLSLSYGGIYSKDTLPESFFDENSPAWHCEFEIGVKHDSNSKHFLSDFISILFAEKQSSFLDYIAMPLHSDSSPSSPFFGIIIELLEAADDASSSNVHVFGISNGQNGKQERNTYCHISSDLSDVFHIAISRIHNHLNVKINDCNEDQMDISHFVGQSRQLHVAVAAASSSHGLQRSLNRLEFVVE